jgi:hypothetical protein
MPTGYESGKAWSPIGAQATVSTSAASRVWTLNEVAAYEGADTWPAPKAGTFEPIATVGSGASNYTFTSIPQTYQDLEIRMFLPGTSVTWGEPEMQTNGAGSFYYRENGWAVYDGSSTSNYQSSSRSYARIGWTMATQISQYITIRINNYTATGIYKSWRSTQFTEVGGGTNPSSQNYGAVVNHGGTLSTDSTNAITQIKFSSSSGSSWPTGTSITLFGIKDS